MKVKIEPKHLDVTPKAPSHPIVEVKSVHEVVKPAPPKQSNQPVKTGGGHEIVKVAPPQQAHAQVKTGGGHPIVLTTRPPVGPVKTGGGHPIVPPAPPQHATIETNGGHPIVPPAPSPHQVVTGGGHSIIPARLAPMTPVKAGSGHAIVPPPAPQHPTFNKAGRDSIVHSAPGPAAVRHAPPSLAILLVKTEPKHVHLTRTAASRRQIATSQPRRSALLSSLHQKISPFTACGDPALDLPPQQTFGELMANLYVHFAAARAR